MLKRIIVSSCTFLALAPLLSAQTLLERQVTAVQTDGWGGVAQLETPPPPKSIAEKDSKLFDTKKQEGFTTTAELGLATGDSIRVQAHFARYFGLPNGDGDLEYREILRQQPEQGHARALQVRRRPGTGQLDIFLVDHTEGQGSYFYHVSSNGTLLRAVHANGRVTPLADEEASRRFATELAYWRQWETDINRSASGRKP